MQISIVLPIYKVEKYLEECLNSIRNQNFQDFEAILRRFVRNLVPKTAVSNMFIRKIKAYLWRAIPG